MEISRKLKLKLLEFSRAFSCLSFLINFNVVVIKKQYGIEGLANQLIKSFFVTEKTKTLGTG